ncbi:MAG: maleylpyruvate isomerase family mycothiol-dependent enzyme [Actinomycetota bacterium]
MAAVAVDRAKTEEAFLDLTAQLGEMLRAAGADTSTKLPRSAWSVAEAASHLVIAGRFFCELAAGANAFYAEGTREALAEVNASKLQAFTDHDGAHLADALDEVARSFLTAAAGRPGTMAVKTPMGGMDLDTLRSYVMTHTMIHGYPLARALGRGLQIPDGYVTLALPFLVAAMTAVVDGSAVGGLNASYLVHLRGGPSLGITFDHGALRVNEPAGRVDCHLSADPVAFFLVAMGLQSQWAAIARGKMVAWGTKPWLAFRLVGYFAVP